MAVNPSVEVASAEAALHAAMECRPCVCLGEGVVIKAGRCMAFCSVPSRAVSSAHALLRAPQMWKQSVGWWSWVQSWQL